MSTAIDISAFEGTDPVLTIAEDVFAAMIDGEPGQLRPWDGERPALVQPVYSWVDVEGAHAGRILLASERGTAERLCRILLGLGADDVVREADMVDALSDADLVDAFGEVANVVGGNVKALVPDAGALSLPQVSSERPVLHPGEILVHDLGLDWRGRLVTIGLWRQP